MKYATQSSRTITHAGCLSPKCFPPSILIGELGKLNEKIQKTKQKEKTKEKEKTRHEKCPYTLSSEFWITCSLNSELQSSKCKCKQRDPITLCYELWLSYNTVFLMSFDVTTKNQNEKERCFTFVLLGSGLVGSISRPRSGGRTPN